MDIMSYSKSDYLASTDFAEELKEEKKKKEKCRKTEKHSRIRGDIADAICMSTVHCKRNQIEIIVQIKGIGS